MLQQRPISDPSNNAGNAALARAETLAKLLAAFATQALLAEAELTPKPGLVDGRSAGAHHDLSLALLKRSATVLQPHFERIAQAACVHAACVQAACVQAACAQPAAIALREKLGALGRAAERDMLAATGNVNTHRGAIWALGLLVAAAAQLPSASETDLCRRAAWLASLPDAAAPPQASHGSQARQAYGAAGARGEAVAGFPHVLHNGLPALRRARAAGVAERHARLDALLAIMATLTDTCLLHRGGPEALQAAQLGAHRTLLLGGSSTRDGMLSLLALDRTLLRLWASPGGAADLLAATLFLDSVCTLQEVLP
jgi:triphosphoribosyl-dephospho-CoA synthase